jgi:hypothetical protein
MATLDLTLNLLTTTIVAPPSNASNWQLGFNSAFKGLIVIYEIFSHLKHNLHIFNKLFSCSAVLTADR